MKKIISLAILFLLSFSTLNTDEIDILKIGSDKAKITVKVFSSLTCPHCANFHNKIFDDLKKEYIDIDIPKEELFNLYTGNKEKNHRTVIRYKEPQWVTIK